MNDWPLASHYVTTLQNPSLAFTLPRTHSFENEADERLFESLRQSTIKHDGKSLPLGQSGQHAVVFQATLPDGTKRAVRAFTSRRPGIAERYQRISEHLDSARHLPFLASFKYYEKGIRASVDGRLQVFPVVVMDWVPGESLFQWVQDRCTNRETARLRQAADQWASLIDDLATAQIAHGDLQHANILVDDRDRFKLIDYDSMCVPSLVGEINLETGMAPYQHRERNKDTCLSLSLDNFSAVFIYVALRSLAARPDLWREYVFKTRYEKLLFSEQDLENPGMSPLLREIIASPDEQLGRLAKRLPELYNGPMPGVPSLKDVLFSYDKVRDLLDQGLFDEVVDLLERERNAPDPPADLKPLIQNAYDRVEQLRKLRQAAQAGDELRIKQLYVPALLDDYPAAAGDVAAARLAEKVIPLLDSLAQARNKGQWRTLMQVWDKNHALLESRTSGRALRTEVENWRPRNVACEAVVRLAAQQECDPDSLQQAWDRLQSLGGHPEIDGHAGQIDHLIRRGLAWKAEHALFSDSGAGSEQRDDGLVNGWNEGLFGGWEVAERERAALGDVQRRRKTLAKLRQAIQTTSSPPSLSGEQTLVAFVNQLPSGYVFADQDRVQLAKRRLALAQQATDAARRQDDLALARLWKELAALEGQLLVTSATRNRATVSEQRSIAWSRFRAALDEVAACSGTDIDAHLIDQWNESLFCGWPLAEQQRDAVDQAKLRQSTVEKIVQCIGRAGSPNLANEQELVSLATQLPCEHKYPAAHRVDLARRRTNAFGDLSKAIGQGTSEDAIVRAADALVSLQALPLVDLVAGRRIALARQRLPILETLAGLSTSLPADQYDEQIRRAWRENLLRDCHQAQKWRHPYETACRRAELLRRLDAAITSRDDPTIGQIACDPLLVGYPLPATLNSLIEETRRAMQKSQRLIEAMRGNQRCVFYEAFDASAIRRCQHLFVNNLRSTLVAWTREEALPLERLCLRAAQGRDSVTRGASANAYCVRWGWPDKRFAEKCIVGIAPQRLNGQGDPCRPPSVPNPITVDQMGYSIDGCWTLFWGRRGSGIVYVWAIIDLGFCTLYSPPLELGTVRPAKPP